MRRIFRLRDRRLPHSPRLEQARNGAYLRKISKAPSPNASNLARNAITSARRRGKPFHDSDEFAKRRCAFAGRWSSPPISSRAPQLSVAEAEAAAWYLNYIRFLTPFQSFHPFKTFQSLGLDLVKSFRFKVLIGIAPAVVFGQFRP